MLFLNIREKNLQVFHKMFMLNRNHTYNTTAATYHSLDIPQVKTTENILNIKFQASETWNNVQRTQNLNF